MIVYCFPMLLPDDPPVSCCHGDGYIEVGRRHIADKVHGYIFNYPMSVHYCFM